MKMRRDGVSTYIEERRNKGGPVDTEDTQRTGVHLPVEVPCAETGESNHKQ